MKEKTLKNIREDQRKELERRFKLHEVEFIMNLFNQDSLEAIKWVREWKKNQQDFHHREDTILWIKHFFNTTEEDLS